MSRQTLANIVFWCLACASAVLLVILLLILGGALPIDDRAAEPAPDPAETLAVQAPRAPAVERSTTSRPPAATTAPRTEPEPPAQPPPSQTTVVMTAVRGDSWFSARLGSENGRVLDERVLTQGESVRLEGKRIWLSVGAAGNVEVTVDGKPRPLSPGTVSVVLTGSPRADET